MSISPETFIVISLMFAVFAAVAAVGTSVVLGAGFERLRAGFEVVRRQSGFFADAIYKLDQRTEALEGETAKLKTGLNGMGERVDRAEKTATFLADSITSIEHRILQGSPAQTQPTDSLLRMSEPAKKVKVEQGQWVRVPVPEQTLTIDMRSSELFRDFPEEAPAMGEFMEDEQEDTGEENRGPSGGLSTLLSQYFMGESSGKSKGVVYH